MTPTHSGVGPNSRSSPDGRSGAVTILELAEVVAAATVVRVPLRVPFRGVTSRIGVVFQGPAGWGEFAPFPEYLPTEASRWLDAGIEAAFVGWPPPLRREVGVNAIIPALEPDDAAVLAVQARADGSRTVKVKVAEPGGSLERDADRVAAVRAGFGDGAIRIDANGAWTPAAAIEAVRRLDRVAGGLQYVEQPCADLAGLAAVRRAVAVPVAADESIRRAEDPLLAVRSAAVDLVVVKCPPLGGVRRALAVIAEAGVPAVVSSALDTGVGLAAGVALAAAMPDVAYDAGLGTGRLLADDLVVPAMVPLHGRLPVRATAPDRDALQRAAARVTTAERQEWIDRLGAAWGAGTARRLPRLLADSQV